MCVCVCVRIQDGFEKYVAENSKIDRESVIWGFFQIALQELEKEPKMQEVMAEKGWTKLDLLESERRRCVCVCLCLCLLV